MDTQFRGLPGFGIAADGLKMLRSRIPQACCREIQSLLQDIDLIRTDRIRNRQLRTQVM